MMEHFSFASLDGIALDGAFHPATTQHRLGSVIQLHGISADMDEGGMFIRLAERLASAGFDVLRFSFRGHGRSGGTQRGVTIAGEILDLQAAVEIVHARSIRPLSIVAASFGAVSACLSLPHIGAQLRGLVLWNPVLDLKRTFVAPELPWAQRSFNAEAVRNLEKHGYLLLDNAFEIGQAMYHEMATYDPLGVFMKSSVPSMIVHGDRDTYVSYHISQSAAQERSSCILHTIEGSDHGFDGRENEDRAISLTMSWLNQLYGSER